MLGPAARRAYTAPVAYSAAWADALPVLRARRPDAAARCHAEFAAGPAEAGCALDGKAARLGTMYISACAAHTATT